MGYAIFIDANISGGEYPADSFFFGDSLIIFYAVLATVSGDEFVKKSKAEPATSKIEPEGALGPVLGFDSCFYSALFSSFGFSAKTDGWLICMPWKGEDSGCFCVYCWTPNCIIAA